MSHAVKFFKCTKEEFYYTMRKIEKWIEETTGKRTPIKTLTMRDEGMKVMNQKEAEEFLRIRNKGNECNYMWVKPKRNTSESNKLLKQEEKLNDEIEKISISWKKRKNICCMHCNKKIETATLSGYKCPFCKGDLRPQEVIDKLEEKRKEKKSVYAKRKRKEEEEMIKWSDKPFCYLILCDIYY